MSAGTSARSPAGRGGRNGATPQVMDRAQARSYYGRPVIKEPVWKTEIAAYFFLGGMAGAAAPLALAAELRGEQRLARAAWLTSLAGVAVSPALLVADLGRPERFLNMLRLFKVTSPMSVGSWILSATGTAVGVAAMRSTFGWFPRAGLGAAFAAAALGPALSTYTAALVANTAVPVWHEARQDLPFVFAASSAASAGAVAGALAPSSEAGTARRLAVAGAVAEVALVAVMERRLGALAEPYRGGDAGRYGKAARALTVAGTATLALGRGRRSSAVLGGALVAAGSACERWSVFRAGFASAADPKYTVGPQRRRADARAADASSFDDHPGRTP